MSRKIFLTGGSGFVGKSLSTALTQSGHQVWSPDFDLTIGDSLLEVRTQGEWDVVIHLAGISDAATCSAQPEKAHLVNVNMTERLMRTLGAQKVQPHFIFASTAMVYRPESHPLTEEGAIAPQNAYAETKYAAEKVVKDLSQVHATPTTVLRLFNHTHHTQDPRFFLPSVYRQLLGVGEKRQPPVISVGNMKVRRDLGTIQDLVKMFLELVNLEKSSFDIFNVCSGQARSLEGLARELAKQMRVDCEFVVDPAKVRKDHEYIVGSSEKLQRRMAWKPEVLRDAQFIERFLAKI
jgi:nucleoside-diphosphate-sugar epimerase